MRISDWSSDVCSSDLGGLFVVHGRKSECASFSRCVDGQTEGDRHHSQGFMSFECLNDPAGHWSCFVATGTVQRDELKIVEGIGARVEMFREIFRSEERRVGKECVSTCRYRLSTNV